MASEALPQPIQKFKYSKRVVLSSILGRDDRGLGLAGERVVVGGWVKAKKEKKMKKKEEEESKANENVMEVAQNVSCCEAMMSRIPLLRLVVRGLGGRDGGLLGKEEAKVVPSIVYLRINDGSCVANLQVVVDSTMSLVSQVMSTGCSILVEGVLEQPAGGKHAVELKASRILHVGHVDVRKYPLANPRLTLEFLRAYPHFRSRTTTIASVTRIRNTLSYATHTFFQTNGFLYVHMPVITTTAGDSTERFQVTTLLRKPHDMGGSSTASGQEDLSLEAVKAAIKAKSDKIEELKRTDSNKEALIAALQDLQKANELAIQLEDKENATQLEAKELDFSKDFFSCKAYLTVSAGLHLESYACALSSVYTFGPIFRAKNSQSTSSLAEMWMVEVELAFADLEDVISCAVDFMKSLIQSTLKDSLEDMKFLSRRIDQDCIERLQSIGPDPFARITYAEAVEELKKAKDKTFETNPEWGICLSEEHEIYLANEVYKQPVIIYEYPKEVKPFYVHVRDDGKTVDAFDIIAPKVGAIIRGSQKEENINKIITRMEELGLERGSYAWYLDLRRHGTVKHSGFSFMFEKMVMFATGLSNIKDAIPFPRSFGSAHA